MSSSPSLPRALDLGAAAAKKSCFLFGPRQTGKSFLVRQALPDALVHDLREEIAAAGAARSLPAFSRFLRVAAACNGTIVKFTEAANDAQVPRTTVYEYFDVLRDMLLLLEVPAWRETELRQPVASSKFYLFDVGVVSALQGREFRAGTPEYGGAFETWLLNELVAHRDYAGGSPISHWRTSSGFEVDFILGDHTAVAAKAKANVPDRELKGLRALAEERRLRRHVCVGLEPRPRKVGDIEVLPWRTFLDELWSGALGASG